ncbi:hypothetical protein SCP_0214760 [Sparassis crispa]|uniref:RSE1/DDB1/CPSF1 C-terminal domain-containing protein n=1 Tax=Sparassis crispa TaxID=139825 RepID=A0A401GDK2_9APHY|nr:hypothetical protein SCP_0214760 [Sparassis crispa]GBE80259.1 hypothetical protein SCP_0214760 [Sparassis crispa]
MLYAGAHLTRRLDHHGWIRVCSQHIAVGTTVNRGEDLAIKGVVYIFEIVEVVPDLSSSHKRWYKLKLRCRDDAKGPVTALCGMDGYLVSSMGQKIFVRAFDLDERLVGVAFLDVGVYVTSLRTIKNLGLLLCALRLIFPAGFIVGREPTARHSLIFVRMMLTPRPSFLVQSQSQSHWR